MEERPAGSEETGPVEPLFALLKTRIGVYLDDENIIRVEAAYRFAAEAHSGQLRVSGDLYIAHPLAVALIVADWHLDADALCAGLLHDVLEDTYISKAEIAERFGQDVSELVDGLTKIDKFKFKSRKEADAENFQKLMIATNRDLRVILIKLADRLHNMRTLHVMPLDKRKRIAGETLELYAPIASQLGIISLCHELEDLSFKHKYPWRYRVLTGAMNVERGSHRRALAEFRTEIEACLQQWGMHAEIQEREKSLYSIYRKMAEKIHEQRRQVLSLIHDLHGFRLIVSDIPSCYLALGALHSIHQPQPKHFKDYIAIPRKNGYQSLHTTVIGAGGVLAEIQIRTQQMHHVAESGIAAHWLYKDNDKNISELQKTAHDWARLQIELQMSSDGASEYLEHVKADLFPTEVFVLSPKGDIFELPRGSTPIDFAYAVHTDVGHRCVGCLINGEYMPPNTELRSGDRVEIVVSAYPSPNPGWLKHVRTGRALAKIRHFLKNQQQDEALVMGKRLLNLALHPHGHTVDSISSFAWNRFLRDDGVVSERDIFADIGLGNRLPVVVARRLLLAEEREADTATDTATPQGGNMPCFKIHGKEGAIVQLARCCQPIPGDKVIGIPRRGLGLEIHQQTCPLATRIRANPGHWVDAEWEPTGERLFNVTLRILCREEHGMLVRIANAIAGEGCNIQSVVTVDEQTPPCTTLEMGLQVRDRVHLARIMRQVRRLPEVLNLRRCSPGA
ncbi:MAG: bifunctional (p)ppGpp synthetase/guanosine-3',5'-bis(diphosphate) 3'-pyrophosphohydrolase [Azoarcus sp.]|nr:bifunctional (p)ppGpp synthetase/guanosine-3',5'-bis(diphosphate) 3'-pyrophosphohydrolase [Azoarcus sp.]